MKNRPQFKSRKNSSGFIVADFLFAFVMVIGVGIFMFALTFSLATIEIGQYIVWSTAHNYAMGNSDEPTANTQAQDKFDKLIEQFPLLTNSDGSSAWFELSKSELKIGELSVIDNDFTTAVAGDDLLNKDAAGTFRQPWTGVSTKITLKLFSNLNIPFLGKVATDKSIFTFPIRAFIIRNVSQKECRIFFYGKRWQEGIQRLESGRLAPAAFGPPTLSGGIENGWGEDNGC